MELHAVWPSIFVYNSQEHNQLAISFMYAAFNLKYVFENLSSKSEVV